MAAPLVWGGNRPLPLLVLECLALAMLCVLAWTNRMPMLPTALRWSVGILLAFPLLQMVPLPASWWGAIPGHGPYASVLDALGANDDWRSISIHRRATEYAWLALLPCVATFLATQVLGRRELRVLALAFAAVVCGEALLGILQVGATKDSLVVLGNPWGGGSATGTYINKNHLAGLLEMGLPILMAFWAAESLRVRGPGTRMHGQADARLARRLGWSLLIALGLAALMFTRSRAGIACGLIAFMAAAGFLVWRGGSRRLRVVLAAVAAAGLLLAAYAGLTPLIDRFAADDLSASYRDRWRIAAAALKAAMDFLPLGSGLGTFRDVFPRYQPEGIAGYVDHAHNDYAEALLEIGLAAPALVGLLGFAFAARWREIARRPYARSLDMLQVAAGLSVGALALHGLFDFNLHIPANAIYFAFLAGVFFRDTES